MLERKLKDVTMRFSVIAPLLFTVGAFVLGMLALFAGSKAGFMEDYDIVTLNTSTLGYASVDDPSPTSSGAAPSATSFGSWLKGTAKNVTSQVKEEIEEEFDEIRNDIADKLADKLGIQQWYSFHLMDMCMGMFSPNATAHGATKNVSQCTNRTAMYHFDPTSQLQQELDEGPLAGKINLSDLGYTDDIQDGIDGLNASIGATFILYCIGIGAAGVLILTTLAAIFLTGRLFSIVNFFLAVLSFLGLGIASAIVTAFMIKITKLINDHGNDIGIYAYRGKKYLAITWAATGAMLFTSLVWVVLFCLGRQQAKKQLAEEKAEAVQG